MKSYERIIRALFYISIIFVFIYKIWLLNVSEWFPFANELGDIFYVLALSYIASYIFYLLVTFFPQRKQKKNVYEYVNYKVELILTNFRDILAQTYLTETDINFLDAQMSLEEYEEQFDIEAYRIKKDYDNMSEQDIKDFFSRISYGGGGAVTKVIAEGTPPTDVVTWGEYLIQNANITHKLVSEILGLLPLLDVEHVTLLSKIQDAPYYYRITDLHHLSKDRKLGFLAPSFIEYYGLMKLLSKELSISINDLKPIPNSHIYLQNIGPRNK